MDLVCSWYDDRYQSEVLFSNTPTHTFDLKVKVPDLELLCLRFALKFIIADIFQTIWWLVW